MAGRYRGEGAISRREDGRWVARYYIRTAGEPKRKALNRRSRSEAATMLARAIAERDGNGPITGELSKLYVSEYIPEWLASKKPELAPDMQEIAADAMEEYAFRSNGIRRASKSGAVSANMAYISEIGR